MIKSEKHFAPSKEANHTLNLRVKFKLSLLGGVGIHIFDYFQKNQLLDILLLIWIDKYTQVYKQNAESSQRLKLRRRKIR